MGPRSFIADATQPAGRSKDQQPFHPNVAHEKQIPRQRFGQSTLVESRLKKCELNVRAPMYSLKAVIGGTEHYQFDAGCSSIRAGEFLLVAPGSEYTVSICDHIETRGFCFYFTEQDAEPIAAVLELLPENHRPPVFDLWMLTSSKILASRSVQSVACGLRKWARAWLQDQARINRVDPLTRARVVRGLQRARRVMDEAFSERWSVPMLAEHAFQSPAAFSRNFARVYSVTPARYLESRRMAHAIHRLEHDAVDLTRLSQDCGYPDLPTFSKAFRRRYGIPPSQWRINHRKS